MRQNPELNVPKWIILALWKIADYKTARGQDGNAYIVK